MQDMRRRLREAGDPAKAPAMQAYMKSALPTTAWPAPRRASSSATSWPLTRCRTGTAGSPRSMSCGTTPPTARSGTRHSPSSGTAGTRRTATRMRCRCTATCSRPARGGTSSTTSPPTWWAAAAGAPRGGGADRPVVGHRRRPLAAAYVGHRPDRREGVTPTSTCSATRSRRTSTTATSSCARPSAGPCASTRAPIRTGYAPSSPRTTTGSAGCRAGRPSSTWEAS